MLTGDSPGVVIKVQEGERVPGDDPAALIISPHLFFPLPCIDRYTADLLFGEADRVCGMSPLRDEDQGSSPFLAGVRERFRDAGRNLVVITVS